MAGTANDSNAAMANQTREMRRVQTVRGGLQASRDELMGMVFGITKVSDVYSLAPPIAPVNVDRTPCPTTRCSRYAGLVDQTLSQARYYCLPHSRTHTLMIPVRVWPSGVTEVQIGRAHV